ncbi:MAG: hypothetical protein V3V18_13075 [Methylococcales bacterium]
MLGKVTLAVLILAAFFTFFHHFPQQQPEYQKIDQPTVIENVLSSDSTRPTMKQSKLVSNTKPVLTPLMPELNKHQLKTALEEMQDKGEILDLLAQNGLDIESASELAEMISTSNQNQSPLIRRDAKIDWKAAEERIGLDPSALSNDEIHNIRNAPLPVLMPSTLDLKGALVIGLDTMVAVSYHLDDINVVISGTKEWDAMPGKNLDSGHNKLTSSGIINTTINQESSEPIVSEPEQITELRFQAYGGHYSIAIECASANDPRCNSDSYILELATNLSATGLEQGFMNQ